jgi:hypothetical protein
VGVDTFHDEFFSQESSAQGRRLSVMLRQKARPGGANFEGLLALKCTARKPFNAAMKRLEQSEFPSWFCGPAAERWAVWLELCVFSNGGG